MRRLLTLALCLWAFAAQAQGDPSRLMFGGPNCNNATIATGLVLRLLACKDANVAGATANGLSGTTNPGTLINGPTATQAPVGYGLNLIGASNQYVSVADNASLRLTSAITICVLFNFPSISGSDVTLVDKTQTGNAAEYRFTIKATTPKLNFWNGTTSATGNATISAGVFSMGCVTISGTTLLFYMNGAADGGGAVGLGASNSGAVLLGRDSFNPGQFNGALNNVLIYSRALPASEIGAIYASSVAGRASNDNLRIPPQLEVVDRGAVAANDNHPLLDRLLRGRRMLRLLPDAG